MKHKKTIVSTSIQKSSVRSIVPVNPDDVGFNDYGHFKHFNIERGAYRTVLITGAGSYIGESFQTYCERNYSNIKTTTIDMESSFWREFNFTDLDGRPFDTVFHVAGIAHADVGNATVVEQEKYYAVNTDLAIECAIKARDAGVGQFIFMSSMIIYGGAEQINEYTIPNPSNFYGNSKWLADKGVRALATKNYKVSVIRPPMIYGKGSKGNYSALSWIARKLPFFPAVENKRSILNIENLCEFVALLTLSGEGGIYFAQNSEYFSTSELVRMIAEANGKNLHISKVLIPAAKVAKYIPGKVGRLASKAFGNSYYDQKLSRYDGLDYCKCSLEESILFTEGRIK